MKPTPVNTAEQKCRLNSPETPDGWIACSKVLPKPFIDVIASDGKQVFTAHFIDEADWWCLVSELAEEPCDITHWMPLPAPPAAPTELLEE